MKFYESPAVLVEEQNQFELDLKEYAKGTIDPTKFKAIRVAHGMYEQRQEHTYMIRIRCAAGGITPKQLKRAAELGDKYGSGEVHFTTRSEIQVHEVLIQDVMTVIRGLLEVGLSTRGGGGNTIRNILTPSVSGIQPGEVFDVDPYAIALTTRMIQEPDSWNLPRKFKIAMSNGPDDSAYTQATCLGYVAKIKDGQKGFEVYCAGGMGARPMIGNLLFEFIPESHVYHVAKALKIMFDKHGNRRSKNSNRIKFLWRKLEREEFVRLFEEEYNKIKDDRSLDLVLPDIKNEAKATSLPVESVRSEAYDLWKSRYVMAQKQDCLYSIKLPLVLGDLIKKDADLLCDFLENFGDNTLRCDRAQNIRIRNIPEAYLGNAFNVISKLSYTLAEDAPFIGNMINCTGAQTCKLGICLPRGLSTAIRDRLVKSELNLDLLSDFRLNMSGCPNTCGMHHIADLGFFGKIGRKDGEIYPAYNVLAGAKTGAGITEYAKKEGELAAHQIPDFVHDFLEDYLDSKDEYPTYQAYLDAEGTQFIKDWCETHKDVPSLNVDPKYYTDFGAKRKLSLDDMGSAECSAGMFDMINVDKKYIETYKESLQKGADKSETLYQILFHTSRMLLVTRGLDAKDETQAMEIFAKHFVSTNLVDESYMDILSLGKLGLKTELPKHETKILALAQDVLDLYQNMDDSLRFKPKAEANPENAPKSALTEKDFRGVACPMNFVKTKLVLETLNSGDQLQITLDDGEPIQNVPGSVKLEGHKVLKQEKTEDGHWIVLIEKK